MPHTYTKQELEERYKKLPEPLKEAMFSPEVAEKMFEIGKKNGLTIEKTGFMAEETGFIILGLTRPREFVGILSERLEIDKDTAMKIASDINHSVLFPLREALKNAHDVEVSEGELTREQEPLVRKPAPLPTDAKPASPTPAPVPPAIMTPRPAAVAVPPPAKEEPTPIPSPAPIPPPQPTSAKQIEAQPIVPQPTPAPKKKPAEMIVPQPMPAAPVEKEKPPAMRTPPTPAVIDLRGIAQQIPKNPPDIPQSIQPAKNSIDLRKSMPENIKEEERIIPATIPQPIKIPLPSQSAPAPIPEPPAPPKPAAPAPIVIPPSRQPQPEPLANIPQNPKIPPIDLRNAPKPASDAAKKSPIPAPKKYDGYDPYREPVE